jgi:hypothetical protein
VPTRLALATILVAISAPLTSGCGLNHVPPLAKPPFATSQEFVLWQIGPAGRAHVVGYGEVGGTVKGIFAHVRFLLPSCTPRHVYFVEGGVPGITSDAEAFRLTATAVPIALSGTIHRSRPDTWRVDLPLAATISAGTCLGMQPLQAEARPGPDFEHRWFVDLQSATVAGGLDLTLRQIRATGSQPALLWANLIVHNGNCSGSANYSQEPRPGSQTLTLKLSQGSTVIIAGLPNTLNPDPPAATRLTLSYISGRCAGQTFTGRLSQ